MRVGGGGLELVKAGRRWGGGDVEVVKGVGGGTIVVEDGRGSII